MTDRPAQEPRLPTRSVFQQRLGEVLESYRLRDSEYFAPNLAADGNRLMTADEWAREIEDRVFLDTSDPRRLVRATELMENLSRG